jgi:Arc/MetJ-type ribon-helix-helix transcriptional regulator
MVERPRAESEKITVNLGFVDLGQIDLLVQDGFYSNRTDFIRTAIRNQLDRHGEVVRQSVARKTLDLGLRVYTRCDLERARARGDRDVSASLARETIASVSVLGALHASAEVRAALGDRMH